MKKLVVFTGAGISAESGIKTFRDSDGLWEEYNIIDVATPQAWAKNPKLVLDFYNQRKAQVEHSKPNKAHKLLAELESRFDVQIITQNIAFFSFLKKMPNGSDIHYTGSLNKLSLKNNIEIKINKNIIIIDGSILNGNPIFPGGYIINNALELSKRL